MRRVVHSPRREWRRRLEEELGFYFHTIGGAPYWDESASWRFTTAEIDLLDDLAVDLYQKILTVCDEAVDQGRLAELGIPPMATAAVTESWRRFRAGAGDSPLYGRFDFAWTGDGSPILLEFNGSVPTSLYESAVVQWDWLQQIAPDADQFNSLQEELVQRWAEKALELDGRIVHFTAQACEEDQATAAYMQTLALEAGLRTKSVALDAIAYDSGDGGFYDGDGVRIDALWTLYPPEWMIQDQFGAALLTAVSARRLILMEPLWRLMTAKGILPQLWARWPDHPALAPAFFTPDGFAAGDEIVAKPLWGREGDGVEIVTLGPDKRPAQRLAGGGTRFAGAEGWVFQRRVPLAPAPGGHAVLGVWMVGERACGLGMREDAGQITTNASRFLPHLFA